MLREKRDLADRISQALAQDKRTRRAVIEVLDRSGTITLLGEVDTLDAKRAAEQIARAQSGVISLINELKIVRR